MSQNPNPDWWCPLLDWLAITTHLLHWHCPWGLVSIRVGTIHFLLKELWMEFHHHGVKTRLCGLQQPTPNHISLQHLKRCSQTQEVAQYFHLSIDPTHHNPNPHVNTVVPSLFTNGLQNLLKQYSQIFHHPFGLPPPRDLDHRIPLMPQSAPINVKPYQYPHFQKTEIEKLVSEMLSKGIIRLSTTPFSSPVLLVQIKDGSWRYYVDYRALNAVTVKDRFLIPMVDELLDELHGASVFSKLDLWARYHQVRIHPLDIKKTTFCSHDGHYEFTVMSFRLSYAPSTFQALMNNVFRDKLKRYVLVFFDDILIYSPNWNTNLIHLASVFTVLHAHSLFAKISKCEFSYAELGYLGHMVSATGWWWIQIRFGLSRIGLYQPTSMASVVSLASQGITKSL